MQANMILFEIISKFHKNLLVGVRGSWMLEASMVLNCNFGQICLSIWIFLLVATLPACLFGFLWFRAFEKGYPVGRAKTCLCLVDLLWSIMSFLCSWFIFSHSSRHPHVFFFLIQYIFKSFFFFLGWWVSILTKLIGYIGVRCVMRSNYEDWEFLKLENLT